MRITQHVVIGGGTMGVGIAYELARSGSTVAIVEPDSVRRTHVAETITRVAHQAVRRGILTANTATEIERSVAAARSLDEIEPRPVAVIEAVPENLELKQQVLREAERLAPGLLATNTSSISITEISKGLVQPARLIGLHFFNPVWVNQLVEIVVTDTTSDHVVARAQELVTAIEKVSIVVHDSPGFASSRLGVLLGLEAIRMLEEEVASAADIDRAMVVGYRHPMGPLKLTDLVGLDVRLAISENLAKTYGERFQPPTLLIDLVRQGRLGKKSGKGFYDWADNTL